MGWKINLDLSRLAGVVISIILIVSGTFEYALIGWAGLIYLSK